MAAKTISEMIMTKFMMTMINNDDILEVKERLEWVEATMEEAIKGLETLTLIIYVPPIAVLALIVNNFVSNLISAKDVGNSCKPQV